jgi:phosphoribosylformimino-5-aminoimidazole carboxamide ribotide isomerase
MRIIPVLDLMQGQVVHAVGGRRQEYQPLHSSLVESVEPLIVARAIRERYQLSEFYVADLDAIAGRPPAIGMFSALLDDGFNLLVDAGLHTAADASVLLDVGVPTIVAGSETVQSAGELSELIDRIGAQGLVFSLDLRNGCPLTNWAGWNNWEPCQIAADVYSRGVRRLLVLDLACVGAGSGLGTDALCRQLRVFFSCMELLAGGGVRGLDDLESMRQCGVTGVLVASALHDKRIEPKDLV